MGLEITGRLVQLLPEQSGTSKTGNTWQKQEFILETSDQYPKKVCFNLWGDKIQMLQNLPEGSQIKVSFDVESREYQSRWYTEAKAWRVESIGDEQSTEAQSMNQSKPIPADPFPDEMMSQSDDNLPF